MNETMSLLLATVILATGGLGLYMYKSDDNYRTDDENYNEDLLFGSSNDGEINNENIIDLGEKHYVTKKRIIKSKTKRNKTQNGTKRMY